MAAVALRTLLDWVLTGAISSTTGPQQVSSLQCSADTELHTLVRRFWEQEETNPTIAALSPEELRCEEQFSRTHSRLQCGRYMVRLPFATNAQSFDGSRQAALRALRSMERRFAADSALESSYTGFMREYERLRHMSLAPQSRDHSPGPRVCYLPHHGVTKTVGDSNRIRMVYNGSARLTAGGSLNDCLHSGPNLLPALADILTRWRLHRFVFTTDIEKMFRQILVHPEVRDLQRILWREDHSLPIREYRLNTVTYGLSCAYTDDKAAGIG